MTAGLSKGPMWIPPRMAARIQRTCLVLGVATVSAGVLAGFTMAVGGVVLLDERGARHALSAATGAVFALVLLMSGGTLTLARGWVSPGRHASGTGFILNRAKASMAIGPLAIPVGAGVLSSFFFYVSFAGRFTWSAEEVTTNVHLMTPAIVAYLCLPAIVVVLCTVNLAIGWPLLRPSQRTIQRYAR